VRPLRLSLSSTTSTTSTEWSSFRRARARGFRCPRRRRAKTTRARRGRDPVDPRATVLVVVVDDFRSVGSACHATTMHGAFSRERARRGGRGGGRGRGRGEEDLFLEAAQEVGPYLSCLLDTPRFARRTQYPLLGSLDNSSASSLSFYLSLPRCLCRSRKSARRLSSAHTHTHARAPVCLSLSFFLLPFHSSSVVSVSRATLRRSSRPRFPVDRQRLSLRLCLGSASSSLHCHEFMGR